MIAFSNISTYVSILQAIVYTTDESISQATNLPLSTYQYINVQQTIVTATDDSREFET